MQLYPAELTRRVPLRLRSTHYHFLILVIVHKISTHFWTKPLNSVAFGIACYFHVRKKAGLFADNLCSVQLEG